MRLTITLDDGDADDLARIMLDAATQLGRGENIYDVVQHINEDTLATASLTREA